MVKGILTIGVRNWCVMAFLAGGLLGVSPTAQATDECGIETEWVDIHDSGDIGLRDDWWLDLAQDSDGNIYACGFEADENVLRRWRVEKFGPSGECLWTDSSIGSGSLAARIAVTPDGGAVAVGMSSGASGLVSLVRKYAPNGDMQWGHVFTHDRSDDVQWSYTISPGPRGCLGPSVAVDQNGSIYVGVYNPYSYDQLIAKFTETGTLEWIKDIGILGSITDLAIAGNGDALGAGMELEPGTFLGRPAVLRFSSNGDLQWAWHQGEFGESGGASAIAVDGNRGYFYVTTGVADLSLAKFMDYAGGPSPTIWIASFPDALGTDVAVDAEGNAWVTGKKDSLWAIMKFSQSLSPICSTQSYDWVSAGSRWGGKAQVPDGSSGGTGVICTGDGAIASCGYIIADLATANANAGMVKFKPIELPGQGRGPAAGGKPGAVIESAGLKPGDVKVTGGNKGYIDPKRGEGARICVYPTSAGEVVLKVVDRRGSVLKEISAPASGSGPVDLVWDGTDGSGDAVTPGIYAVLIKGPGVKKVQKVAVVY